MSYIKSFITGIYSLFNISGVMIDFGSNDRRTDYERIADDWKKVGDYMYQSIEQFKGQHSL